jgi:hypothetical protein
MRAAALEDYRAYPREVLLPGLRSDHRSACALPSDPEWLCRAEPAGDGAGQQVPAASAVEPPERDLYPRGIEIDVSTLADRVGACVVALDPIIEAIRIHVMSADASAFRRRFEDMIMDKIERMGVRVW